MRLPALLYRLVADLFEVRRSSAAMPFAIGDDGLGGISDGNLACSCSRRALFRASCWGGRDILVARPKFLTTGNDLVYCSDNHDQR